jgi:hypothetical protein
MDEISAFKVGTSRLLSILAFGYWIFLDIRAWGYTGSSEMQQVS